MEAAEQKRGRGRPPKPENVEKLAEKRKLAEAAALEPKEKRGRGRPKGSTKAKGRGRPRKIVSDPEADDEENSEAKPRHCDRYSKDRSSLHMHENGHS